MAIRFNVMCSGRNIGFFILSSLWISGLQIKQLFQLDPLHNSTVINFIEVKLHPPQKSGAGQALKSLGGFWSTKACKFADKTERSQTHFHKTEEMSIVTPRQHKKGSWWQRGPDFPLFRPLPVRKCININPVLFALRQETRAMAFRWHLAAEFLQSH